MFKSPLLFDDDSIPMADDEQIVEVQEVGIESIPVHIKNDMDSEDDNDGESRQSVNLDSLCLYLYCVCVAFCL